MERDVNTAKEVIDIVSRARAGRLRDLLKHASQTLHRLGLIQALSRVKDRLLIVVVPETPIHDDPADLRRL